MKTINEWLSDNLNYEDTLKAYDNYSDAWQRTTVNNFQDALRLAFDWSHSYEGAKYWSIIARNGGSLEVPEHINKFLNETIREKVTDDTVVQEVMKDLNDRSKVGIKKYNTTLDRDDLSPSEWGQHLYEELLDAALYVKKLIQKLKENENEN